MQSFFQWLLLLLVLFPPSNNASNSAVLITGEYEKDISRCDGSEGGLKHRQYGLNNGGAGEAISLATRGLRIFLQQQQSQQCHRTSKCFTQRWGFDLDNMISTLLSVAGKDLKKGQWAKLFPLEQLSQLNKAVRHLLVQSKSTLAEISPPVTVVGDVHGQYVDLLGILERNGFPGSSGGNRVDNQQYLFLGDYVDRGPQQLETISLLFCLKLKYPHEVHLLRGNHETPSINAYYGFRNEIQLRYKGSHSSSPQSEHHPDDLWLDFNHNFQLLPYAGLIGGRILGVHGGLSPLVTKVDQLRRLRRDVLNPEEPSAELHLMWSDPDTRPGATGWRPSRRGAGYAFGADVLRKFCERNKLDLVVRAHQVMEDGYEFFADGKLVTIFSAPRYPGWHTNAAATMDVDEELNYSFNVYY